MESFFKRLIFSGPLNKLKKVLFKKMLFSTALTSSLPSAILFAYSLLLFGRGTALGENVLNIITAQELVDFSVSVNRGTNYAGTTVYLNSDIDFSNPTSQEFQPIGDKTNYFKGVFDGQGHAVKNLVMNMSSQFIGLFGYSKGGTIIENVVIDSSCSFVSTLNSQTEGYIGSITGDCESCVIENIMNMGSVTFAGNAISIRLSGIVGRILGSSSVRNCVNYGQITNIGFIENMLYIGGIVGTSAGSDATKSIQNCINYGTITTNGPAHSLYAGGILGNSFRDLTIIENCVSAGRIANFSEAVIYYIKSVVGYHATSDAQTTISNCLWTSDVGYDDPLEANPNTTGFSVKDSSQIEELNITVLNRMNEYSEKNSTFDRWVLLHLNGGRINSLSQETLFVVKKHIAEPVKEGSTFLFWCKTNAAECADRYDPQTDTSDVTELFAHYNSSTYTLTFVFNNGRSDEVRALNEGATIDYPADPVKEGHTFAGWDSNPDRMPGNDLVITAQWTSNSRTDEITFDLGNGTKVTKNAADWDIYQKTISSETKTGQKFGGWFTGPDGTGEKIEEFTPEVIGGNRTIYAFWEPMSYTITFVFGNGQNNEVRTLEYNATIEYPTNVSRNGYVFDKWDSKPERMPANNITVTAEWIEATGEMVEIIFGRVDFTEEEVKEILKKYTDGEFVIVKFEPIEERGETRIITKFVDREVAENFYRVLKGSDDYGSLIKRVYFATEAIGSFSPMVYPFLSFLF